ncbi:MAG TPA: glycosyltransferase family 4 protein [Candidatus Saccharimonadales bacterium]|nr:glycosyltransferase family 4 protein [Candidatus Saccharimonadales bacterium]
MTADTIGGVWTYSLELARALEGSGIEIILATMGAPLTDAQRAETKLISGLEVHSTNYRLEWMEHPWEDVAKAGHWLLALEERFQPDIIHLNGYAHGALPWSAPVVVVAHSCVLSWWRAVKREEPPDSLNHYREKVLAGLRGADLIVAPTQSMLTEVEAIYGKIRNGRVIHNGQVLSRPEGASKEAFIFSAGRLWDEAKNVSLLAAIAPRLSWPVYLAGEQNHPDGNAGVKHENVNLLGRLSLKEMEAMYGRASIYALPARYEPFGLSALEAALAGSALVLGNIPSLREVWGHAAIFASPDDPEAWEMELKKLIADRTLMSDMATAACRRAVEYSTEKMGSEYLSAYTALIREKENQVVCNS